MQTSCPWVNLSNAMGKVEKLKALSGKIFSPYQGAGLGSEPCSDTNVGREGREQHHAATRPNHHDVASVTRCLPGCPVVTRKATKEGGTCPHRHLKGGNRAG